MLGLICLLLSLLSVVVFTVSIVVVFVVVFVVVVAVVVGCTGGLYIIWLITLNTALRMIWVTSESTLLILIFRHLRKMYRNKSVTFCN